MPVLSLHDVFSRPAEQGLLDAETARRNDLEYLLQQKQAITEVKKTHFKIVLAVKILKNPRLTS